ncbi:hypothetical protein AYI69_g8145, partial [Smittium culicis]
MPSLIHNFPSLSSQEFVSAIDFFFSKKDQILSTNDFKIRIEPSISNSQ